MDVDMLMDIFNEKLLDTPLLRKLDSSMRSKLQ